MSGPTILLTGEEIRTLLTPEDCIVAVERAFLRLAQGGGSAPPALGVPVREGGFHLKAAVLEDERTWFAAKVNGNFPGNRARHGLPTIQGVIVLADAADGRVLALMDSMEITRQRTGAATAVAAKYLARADSGVATLFGCGVQGSIQLECLSRRLPLTTVFAGDPDAAAAARVAAWASTTFGIEARPVGMAEALDCTARSDVIVTCTPSNSAFLGLEHVRPGTFIAAVGADDARKQELEPALLAAGTLVVDVLEQCAAIGDLHHALEAGAMRREDVHAELKDVVSGARPGRTRADEITIFDSTGTAIEDVAAAAMVYQRALAAGRGAPIQLA